MDEPDGMLITRDDFIRIVTPEQAENFVDHKIDIWSNWTLHSPPPPTDELTGREYLTWRNRAMMAYGEITGSMQMGYAVGMIGVEQFKAIKLRVISATTRKAAAVQMGIDP